MIIDDFGLFFIKWTYEQFVADNSSDKGGIIGNYSWFFQRFLDNNVKVVWHNFHRLRA